MIIYLKKKYSILKNDILTMPNLFTSNTDRVAVENTKVMPKIMQRPRIYNHS